MLTKVQPRRFTLKIERMVNEPIMFSNSKRKHIQSIITRISNGDEVSLKERVFIHNLADNNPEIDSWLKRARRFQQDSIPTDAIEELIHHLDLGFSEPQGSYSPKNDDLGEWFSGAPSWVARS